MARTLATVASGGVDVASTVAGTLVAVSLAGIGVDVPDCAGAFLLDFATQAQWCRTSVWQVERLKSPHFPEPQSPDPAAPSRIERVQWHPGPTNHHKP